MRYVFTLLSCRCVRSALSASVLWLFGVVAVNTFTFYAIPVMQLVSIWEGASLLILSGPTLFVCMSPVVDAVFPSLRSRAAPLVGRLLRACVNVSP